MFYENSPSDILAYLENQLPDYPANPDLDTPFLDELVHDFPDVNILEQIKAFRWYYDNSPSAYVKNVRVALRRWIANSNGRNRP
jgi:hypothetical protein